MGAADPTLAPLSPARLLLLLAFCLSLFLPGLTSLPATDRDESRFAQASRQMVESGNYLDIYYQDEVRYKKPVGIYWLQAAAVKLVGDGADSPIWVYRLPSTLAAILAVVLLYLCGRRMAGEPVAWAAALLLASTLVLNTEARAAKTDAVLLATVVAALGSFGVTYVTAAAGRRINALVPWAGWLAIGVGLLIKGPITPLVAALAVLALAVADRGSGRVGPFLRALRPLSGVILLLLVAAPWFIAIVVKSQGLFLQKSVGGDLLPKLMGGEESHGAPPGYYALSYALMAWPGGLAAALGLPWIWANRHLPWVRFALAWAVPGFLLFELVPTKLPHYTLPFYPAIMLLGAGALATIANPASGRIGRLWRVVVIGLFILTGLLIGGGAVALPVYFTHTLPVAAVVALVAALLTLAAGLYALFRGPVTAFPLVTAIGAACVYAAVIGGVLPAVDRLWPARGVAEALAAAGIGADRPLVAVGYSEPSLVFSTRTDIRLLGPEAAAAVVVAQPQAVAIINQAQRAAFDQAVTQISGAPIVWQEIGRVAGLNLSRGRPLDLALLIRKDSRQ